MPNNQEYWNGRIKVKREHFDKKQEKLNNENTKIFKQGQLEINDFLTLFFAKYGIKTGNKIIVPYQKVSQPMNRQELERFQNVLDRMEIDAQNEILRAKVRKYKRKTRVEKYRLLELQNDYVISNITTERNKTNEVAFATGMTSAYLLMMKDIESGLEKGRLDFPEFKKAQIQAALNTPVGGRTYSQAVWGNAANTSQRIQ